MTIFIDDEMTLVNDPLFSREAVEQYEDKPLKPHKPKKIQNYAVKENQETRNEKIQSAQFLKTNMTLRSVHNNFGTTCWGQKLDHLQ